MPSVWIFQDSRQKQKLGDACPWSCGWLDPSGKRKSKRVGSRSLAEKRAAQLEGKLADGTYESAPKATWAAFIEKFRTDKLAGMKPGSRAVYEVCIAHFERIARPVKMSSLKATTFSGYVAKRRLESKHGHARKHCGVCVAAATMNLELRHLRAIVRKAAKWGYLPRAPEIEFLREPGRLPVYVTPECFAKLYEAADAMRWPAEQPYSAGDWWRAILIFAYMTGWRIGSILSLRREDVDLDAATAISRAEFNKGGRDVLISLHPLAVDHLRRLASFSPLVFSWPHSMRQLYDEFHDLQDAAGVAPAGGKTRFGWHDLRRGFATMNSDRVSADVLQVLMQHRDYGTTQRYISIARQVRPASQDLFVPPMTSATAS